MVNLLINLVQWFVGAPRRTIVDAAPDSGLATRLLIAGMISVTLGVVFFGELGPFVLVPSESLAWSGLPWLLSFFLHVGVVHLVVNAAFLFTIGEEVEAEVGTRRFMVLLVVSELCSSLACVLFLGEVEGVVGASGGISGVLVAHAIALPWREYEVPAYWLIVPVLHGRFWVALAMPWLVLIWFVTQLLLLWLGPEGIAVQAHLAGGAGGALVASYWRTRG